MWRDWMQESIIIRYSVLLCKFPIIYQGYIFMLQFKIMINRKLIMELIDNSCQIVPDESIASVAFPLL